MGYPASMLKQEITRRLNGSCRLDIRRGKAMSFLGDALLAYSSCASCFAPCSWSGSSGEIGQNLSMKIEVIQGEFKIPWACPECGRETVEKTNLLKFESVANEIEADPLCFACRGKKPA